MSQKIRKGLEKVCDVMEIVIAVVVGIGLLIALIQYLPTGWEILTSASDSASFLLFLEDMFIFIVGVEFIKMLCRPSAENVVEVLAFLVARHMIMEASSAYEILLCVVSISLLYMCRMLLHWYRKRAQAKEKAEMEEDPDQKADRPASDM